MVIFAALLCLAAGANAELVQQLRVAAQPERTRAVLDLSGPVDYRLFTLESPFRVVLDLDEAALASGFTSGSGQRSLLRSVRTGPRGSDGVRVVLDLKTSARPKSFLLGPSGTFGHRLVIDLYPNQAGHKAIKTVRAASQDRDIVVAIDAGHGGRDPGAIGPSGFHEKVAVLAIAKALKAQLDARPGMRGELIRKDDTLIPRQERFAIAREMKADLFVSIHADAFYDSRVRGSSVYVLSRKGASSAAARWLAADGEARDNLGGVQMEDKDEMLTAVLLDLSQTAALDASNQVAQHILSSLARIGKTHKKRVERANFAVLKAPDVPSVLVETAYISNPSEEKRLKDPAHQRKIAGAILEGIQTFFYASPPPGTWLAKNRTMASHRVSPGETLSGIALQHSVSLKTLKAVNSLKNDRVRAGAVLKIPSS